MAPVEHREQMTRPGSRPMTTVGSGRLRAYGRCWICVDNLTCLSYTVILDRLGFPSRPIRFAGVKQESGSLDESARAWPQQSQP